MALAVCWSLHNLGSMRWMLLVFSIMGIMIEVRTWEVMFCKEDVLNIVMHVMQEHLVAQWGVNDMCVASWG